MHFKTHVGRLQPRKFHVNVFEGECYIRAWKSGYIRKTHGFWWGLLPPDQEDWMMEYTTYSI